MHSEQPIYSSLDVRFRSLCGWRNLLDSTFCIISFFHYCHHPLGVLQPSWCIFPQTQIPVEIKKMPKTLIVNWKKISVHYKRLCTNQFQRCASPHPPQPWGICDEYRIKISRMSPNRIFMFLINPPSRNVRIQKLIAKHIFDCFEKRKEEMAK